MYTRRDWALTAFPALFFSFIVFLLIVAPVGDALTPDNHSAMWSTGAEMVETGEMPQVWPDGVKLDKNKTTQRVFVLKSWDGNWAKWSWTGGSTSPMDSGTGWFFWVAYGIIPVFLSLLAGFGIACLIPEDLLERVLCA